MRRALWWIPLALACNLVHAQVVEGGNSRVATANAVTPGCNEADGGAGATAAAASCDAQGYTAVASASASSTLSADGGTASASAYGVATSTGSISNFTATGSGNGQIALSWSMLSATHYSLSVTVAGGGTAAFSDGMSGPLPPSGILPADVYQLNVGATALAQARDINGVETVIAGPVSASARVSFAEVGSTTLILGTVLAGGVGTPGLLVEARVGGTVVASTLTGDDGSYLLPDLPGTVTLRISDPAGGFAPRLSAPLMPPATFDVDLEPILFADGFEEPGVIP